MMLINISGCVNQFKCDMLLVLCTLILAYPAYGYSMIDYVEYETLEYDYITHSLNDSNGTCLWNKGNRCETPLCCSTTEYDCRCCDINVTPDICSECKGERANCASTCCLFPYICNDDGICTTDGGVDFVSAAKIAVLIALVVTFIAVLVSIYRGFIQPSYCGRSRQLDRSGMVDPDTHSLNSVQRFVLSRLEDRPPAYDHQPEKPPSYEECVPNTGGISTISEPLSYSVNVEEINCDPPPYPCEMVSLNPLDLEVPSPVQGMNNFQEISLKPAGHVNESFVLEETTAPSITSPK